MTLDQYLATRVAAFEDDLCELLRIPSVSTNPANKAEVARAGEWVANALQSLGLKTEIVPTAGHPIVYAESPPVPGKPVALVYGHYDVQPPEPLEEWITPPFEPAKRNGNVYARGATDDKGQMLTHVKSVQAWLETAGRLPLQVKFVIEGEEEIGSSNLEPFLMANRERLACDVVIVSDTGQFAPGQPAITYGLRGIAYYELRLTGPNKDLHSGSFGGAVANPATALAKMLAALTNERGEVQIPGFYDDVLPISAQEKSQLASLPFDEAGFKHRLGVSELLGEAGYTTLERRWARPSFDVNGILSGYTGAGAKTVLPARAAAKFSFRLVPNQQPEKVTELLRSYLQSICPPGITMELEDHHGSPGMVVPLESPFLAAAANAIESGFGAKPVFIREGGSIPIVARFAEVLNADVLLLGWGLDDDGAHSPNEKFCLADYHRGIKASARLWEELGRM